MDGRLLVAPDARCDRPPSPLELPDGFDRLGSLLGRAVPVPAGNTRGEQQVFVNEAFVLEWGRDTPD